MTTTANPLAAPIVRALCYAFKAEGCEFRLLDEAGDELVARTSNVASIIDNMGATSETILVVYRDNSRLGSVLLIEGNDWDVISDNSVTLEEMFPYPFKAAYAQADRICERHLRRA